MNKKALYTILIIIILVLIFVGLKITGNVVSKSQTNFVYFDAEKSDEISTFDSYAALTYWSKEGYDFVLTSSKKEADISVVWKKETVEEHNKNKDGLTIHLGDSKCNSWNYYDDSTLETLLIHNLGHAIGKEDSQDPKYFTLYIERTANTKREVIFTNHFFIMSVISIAFIAYNELDSGAFPVLREFREGGKENV